MELGIVFSFLQKGLKVFYSNSNSNVGYKRFLCPIAETLYTYWLKVELFDSGSCVQEAIQSVQKES